MKRSRDDSGNGALDRRTALREAAHRSPHAPGQTADPAPSISRQARGPLSNADVFISYSRRDRAVVEPLASYFLALSIEAWWDIQINSGENFSHAIQVALASARAVIVIWSDTSVVSDYVLDEASFARDRGKLITTHVPGFDAARIPLGFRQRQSECVEDRARLLRSLGRFGINPHAHGSRTRASAS